MEQLTKFLHNKAIDGILATTDQLDAVQRFRSSWAQVEEAAFAVDILPVRYLKNQKMFSLANQRQLFHSKVAVIGCGGLGGYLIEELARLGVGQIVAIDPDIFEDTNLNRQLFSTMDNLGQAKVLSAAQRVNIINPAVNVESHVSAFSAEQATELLAGADLVADAVDNIPIRFELAQSCLELQLPFVHTAIAGWYGHICTIFPGEKSLEKIYPQRSRIKGVEQYLGNPSFTPSVLGGFATAEICKVLLGHGALLRGRKLLINLLEMEVEEITL